MKDVSEKKYLDSDTAYNAGTLSDWYISSVDDSDPIWTDAHIDELVNDFYVIPKDTPTVDVAPVVHGYWFYHYNGFNYIGICSNCGKQTAFCKTLDGAPHGYPHCPYCTAKMDESEDNDNGRT